MYILVLAVWAAAVMGYPFSSSIIWYDVDIDMSNVDVVITLANGTATDYLTVVNTVADVNINNIAVTLPNSTVINSGQMVSYISEDHDDIYDFVMSAAGYTENFVRSMASEAQAVTEQLSLSDTVTSTFGGTVVSSPTGFVESEESDVDGSTVVPALQKRYKAGLFNLVSAIAESLQKQNYLC